MLTAGFSSLLLLFSFEFEMWDADCLGFLCFRSGEIVRLRMEFSPALNTRFGFKTVLFFSRSGWLLQLLVLLAGGSWTHGVDSFSACIVSTDIAVRIV